METKCSLIPEGHRLTGAATKGGFTLGIYDDGFDGDPLFILSNCFGASAVIRAKSWEDAYSICEDEFFDEADETMEEIRREYGFRREHHKIIRSPGSPPSPGCNAGERFATPADYTDNGKLPSGLFLRWHTVETPDPEAWYENELFQEGYGFRPNGPNAKDVRGHGIYQKDEHSRLDGATAERLAELGITLTTEEW